MPMGENKTYVAATATGHRPIPMVGEERFRVPAKVVPSGLDWSKHRAPDAPPVAAPPPVAPTPHPVRRARTPRRTPTVSTRGPRVDTDTIVQLYVEDQLTIPDISTRLGHGRATVRAALLRAGVELRDDRARNSGGRNRKTTADDDPQMVALFRRLYVDEHFSTAEIGSRCNCSSNLVNAILTRAGVELRPPAHTNGTVLTPDVEATIADRYRAGESSAAVAKAFKVRAERVRDIARRAGVEIRRQQPRPLQEGVTSLQVKQWALTQGLITAIQRGRVAGDLVDAYTEAHR